MVALACAQQPVLAPESGYVLGPDDQIVIRVLEGMDLGDKPILIDSDGHFSLPLIGRVQAGGLTVQQLETELTTRLKQYVQDPQVTVTVVGFHSQPVSVFGAVTTPGIVQLHGRKTLYEVLAMAGGPREVAGATISIVRRAEYGPIPLPGAGPDATGRYSTAEVDLGDVLDGKNPAVNIEVKPYDVISVSEGSNRMVYVVGDVEHSGAFNLGEQRDLSVLRALSLAGGLGHTAKPEQARIFRPSSDGRGHREIPVNIAKILKGNAEDVPLRPNDVLVVPTSSRRVFTVLVSGALAGAVSAAIYAGAVAH